MTRSDLATKLSLRMKVSKDEADRYLLSFLNAIETGLEKDKRVVMQGFGSFRVKEYKERMGKNPATGKTFHIPVRRKPVFQPGKELRSMVNRLPKTEKWLDITSEEIAAFAEAHQ
ncbi:MAG: HU family DNA-binding protein [Nitrospinales bacterium]